MQYCAMRPDFKDFMLCALSFLSLSVALPAAPVRARDGAAKPPTMSEVLAATTPADWQPLDPENTLYMDLPSGRVIIELAPAFAPLHVRNIKTLARAGYYDGLAIDREQDNYVAQWGDPENRHSVPAGIGKTAPEFDAPLDTRLAFMRLPDGDIYAPEVGFSAGFPMARSAASQRMWLAHCYAMVGVGRDLDPESGSGVELYAVIGHAPRHLDRNVALVGRVVRGMQLLSGLPRGSGELGMYTKDESRLPIKSIRLAADVPPAQRVNLEVMRTDTSAFTALIESRRNRHDAFFVVPAGHIDLCNVPIPVRERPPQSP
jgi:peptidylprolyl isomerase